MFKLRYYYVEKVSCLIVLLLAFFGISQSVSAQSKYHYSQELNGYNGGTMELRSGTNGGMFNCRWDPANVGFNNGLMNLKIGSDGRGGYTGGEWRSRERFGYGLFQVNMKPIKIQVLFLHSLLTLVQVMEQSGMKLTLNF